MNREDKINLLKRIQSGELKLSEIPTFKPERHYTRQPDGLFSCIETGELCTLEKLEEAISVLPNHLRWFSVHRTYDQKGEIDSMKIDEISRLEQITPFGKNEFLAIMKEATAKRTILFPVKEYVNGETPQPNDLFEANEDGQKFVKRLSEIEANPSAMVWDERKTR